MDRLLDERMMRRAIELARAALGATGDNPAVGCVIAADDYVVAEAATAPAGRPHAEESALAFAGAETWGSTAYVTLEPCAERSSGGLSCSELLIAAKVARVVIASADPSSKASGRGEERLLAAGIAVETGFLAAEADPLYAEYRRRF
jgi:diaminohydroxyphosphoribosylaminopyrimidine deaminase/5-amino-6-(5-phosphoribosylamino)uracil reductase